MAEIVSLEAAKVAANTKMRNDEALGKVSVVTITSPATQVIAQNDTIASPVKLPVGTRIVGYRAQFGAHGASTVLDIGLRQANAAATVIDADGIADGIDISSAGDVDDTDGAAGAFLTVATQTIYRTTVESYIYASYLAANPTDNAQLRIDVFVVLPG
jgi:hypothetical protein